jgi:hypothetical protein
MAGQIELAGGTFEKFVGGGRAIGAVPDWVRFDRL